MRILFSPSEEKHFIYKDSNNYPFAYLDDLLFGSQIRLEVVSRYIKFLRDSSSVEISKLFGIKGLNNSMDLLGSCSNIDCANVVESVLLYNGVAYKALDCPSLPKKSIEFIFKNVLIFSNLFGVIRASDKIPFYKLKQGECFDGFSIKEIYAPFTKELDEYLKDKFVLDLRAEFYTKAYKLQIPHMKVEFFKNGKKITHLSKYYRGILLRNVALNGFGCMDIFEKLDVVERDGARVIKYEVSNYDENQLKGHKC